MGVPQVRDGDQDKRSSASLCEVWVSGGASVRGTRRPSASRPGDPSLPLAAAAERLRGKPGRPRKDGHVVGIAVQQRGMDGSPNRGALAVAAIVPRLLSLDATAAYLGLSPWTVRDLEAAGVLPRVRVPRPNGGELRKVCSMWKTSTGALRLGRRNPDVQGMPVFHH